MMANEVTSSTDINTKYQKLATEYAKLRGQVVVLKKGVIDEQEKNANLNEQIHEKDMHIRKFESEMESVLFRNQQLSKRVNFLQEEIDTMQSKSKSKWRQHGGAEKDRSDKSVINEELVAKITENARLHSTLEDIEKQYENTIRTLQTRIQDLEKEKADMGNELRNKDKSAQETSADIRTENEQLRSRVTLMERDLALRAKQVDNLEVQLEVVKGKNKHLESVVREDFGCQYEYQDPEEQKRTEEKERELFSLDKRLGENMTRLREAEKEKEHWKLEYQLLQIKMEKMDTTAQSSPPQVDADIEELMLGREDEIKGAYEKRLAEIINDRLQADSKATAFYLESEALANKISEAEEDMAKIEDNLTKSRAEVEKVEEERRVLQLNYEEQLSVMSDHLAEMNSKLASQEDTILQLRQQLGEAESKKGKSKK